MDIILFMVLGLIAGWLASVVMGTNSSQGFFLDIALGIVGAIVGGFIMSLLGQPGVTGLDLYSVLVASVGAIALIWIGRRLSLA